MKSYQYDGTYLENFDEHDRSFVVQQFCLSFREWREGKPLPSELHTATCARVLRAYREGDPRTELLEGIYNSLKSDEALRFAAFIVQREQLPPMERARLKQQQATQFREQHMASLPVTPKQISFLRSLGCTETPANRAEASRMIDSLVNKRKAA